MFRKQMILFSVLFLLGTAVSFAAATPDSVRVNKEKAAIAAANWLKLIDDGKYLESWKESAGVFRAAITQDKWTETMRNGRAPFGETVSRKVKESKYFTELPGAPKGEYVVIQFETLFANRKGILVETVTPLLDKDKKWRVSGYFIK